MTIEAVMKLTMLVAIVTACSALPQQQQQQEQTAPIKNDNEDPQLNELEQQYRNREQNCQASLTLSRLSSIEKADKKDTLSCLGQFDGFLCWPSIPAGSNLSLPCPMELFKASSSSNGRNQKQGVAKRRCTTEGRWRRENVTTNYHPLTDYSDCLLNNNNLTRSLYKLMRLTKVSNKTQQLRLILERRLCRNQAIVNNQRDNVAVCPSVFDGVACWPAVPAGTTGTLPCPDYLNEVQRDKFASRICHGNSTWHLGGWTNFSECLSDSHEAAGMPTLNATDLHSNTKMHLAIMSKIGLVGHSLSLTTLLISIVILASFRRLHCRRNVIHINLYSAFGLRAVSHFVNSASSGNNQTILCRLNQTLMTFTVIASFTWVFVEALHLYMLIFVSVLDNGRLSTTTYIVIGWGLSTLVTVVWILFRLLFDNTNCWRDYKPLGPDIWLLNIYLALLVVLNAALFVKIVRELFIKLRRQSPNEASPVQPYLKLWKSTCLLVLVFGVYYIIFLPVAMVPKDRLGETLDIVHLYYEHFFNSFQGFFAALLFCFVNSEVRHELRHQASRLRLTACWMAVGNQPATVAGANRGNNRLNSNASNTQQAEWSHQRSARRRGERTAMEERIRQQLATQLGDRGERQTEDTDEGIPLQSMVAGSSELQEVTKHLSQRPLIQSE